MTSQADFRKWNDWSLPIAARYPKNPSHPFCTGHTYDPLQCGLPEFSPETLAADRAAYALIERYFSEAGEVPPTLERLAAYAPHFGSGAVEEASDRAARILGIPAPLSYQCRWASAHSTITLVVPWAAWTDESPPIDAWFEDYAVDDDDDDDDDEPDSELLHAFRLIPLHTLVERVMELQKAGAEAPNPLVPLIREVPLEVAPSLSTERRILPAMPLRGSTRTHRPSHENLFQLGGDSLQQVGTSSFLPGFRLAGPNKSPLLELWELGAVRQSEEGRKRNKGGHVVPIVQRIFIEALLGVPFDARGEIVVVYPVRLDRFLDWIWPHQHPSRGRYTKAVEQAAAELDGFRVNLFNEETSLWGRHRIVDLLTLPTWTRRPSEEEIRIRVHLPPGSQQGPPVSDRLRLYSVDSRPCWQVLLTAPFMWHDPGRTRVRAGKAGPWVPARQRKRYPVLSNDDLVKLVLPINENRAPIRQASLPRAVEHLKRLQQDGELCLVDGGDDQWQVLPPEFLEWERQ